MTRGEREVHSTYTGHLPSSWYQVFLFVCRFAAVLSVTWLLLEFAHWIDRVNAALHLLEQQ